MLEEPIQEGVPPKMKGSVLMCVADTEEEVLERVRRDVYWSFGGSLGARCAGGLGGNVDVGRVMLDRDGFADYLYLSRCRLFRSKVLLGRLLTSEWDGMKTRFA